MPVPFPRYVSSVLDAEEILGAKVDTVAPIKIHVAGAVKDKLLKELEGRTGETDSEEEEEIDAVGLWW